MFAGAAAWFPVYFFPVVRFAASDEWVKAVWFLAVPLLWIICVLQVWFVYGNPERHDKFMIERSQKKGWVQPRDSVLLQKSSGLHALMMVAGPVFVRFFYLCILLIWAPIVTVLFVRGPVAHDFIVEDLRDSFKGPDTIEFAGHYVLLNGLPSPPTDIWNTAEPGDTIRLHGTGNRWGVFYDEIELIKQE